MTFARPYSDKDDAVLVRMVKTNKPWPEIAAALNRPIGSVQKRSQRLKILVGTPRQNGCIPVAASELDDQGDRQIRKCLGPCGKPFLSRGIHNRMCQSCRKSDMAGGMNEVSVSVRRRA